jgi:hypothetical protein
MKTHVMLDLETLGTANSNVVITAIGAVTFNQQEILHRFYTNVSIDSCLSHGLTVDGGAIKFWLLEASPENRKDLFDPQPRGLRDALSAFTTFYQQNDGEWLWSHGSNFDQPVLQAAYQAVYGNFVPWKFRSTRDTRTLFSLLPFGKANISRIGGKHNALSDAEYQAACVQAAYTALGKEMETG